MTLLTMINDVQDRIGLPRSSVVVSSTEQNVRRLLAWANVEGKALMKRYGWQALQTENTFTSLAQASQTGAIPADFDRFINNSMFNRTRKRRVTGPLAAKDWQSIQATSASIMTDSFRVRGNAILLSPTPPAGDTYAYEYISNLWVDSDADGDGDLAAWTADTQTSLLPEFLMGLGTEWRFLKAVGLDYAESFNTYEEEVVQAIMRDGGQRTISLANDPGQLLAPAIGVPEDSWPL